MNRTVVWDVDDVLNDLTRVWLEDVWRPAHPTCDLAYEDLLQNPPHALLGIESGEYLASLDEFRLSAGYAQLTPNRDILAWLRGDGERSRHVALTATSLRAAPATASWVFTHFGRWIREFAVLPSPRHGEPQPIYDTDKGAWLARHAHPAVLVDDSPRNIESAVASSAEALCWPRPWNGVAASVPETLQALTDFVDLW
jgi:hypothetical protein